MCEEKNKLKIYKKQTTLFFFRLFVNINNGLCFDFTLYGSLWLRVDYC